MLKYLISFVNPLGAHSRGLDTLSPRVSRTKPWIGALRPWFNLNPWPNVLGPNALPSVLSVLQSSLSVL
jgi:hypothetical protein